MQHLDRQVIEQALTWCQEGKTVWLCTVLATFGSSPRAPGSWMAVDQAGKHIGSLSGGCVEEDFIQRLREGEAQSRESTADIAHRSLRHALGVFCHPRVQSRSNF